MDTGGLLDTWLNVVVFVYVGVLVWLYAYVDTVGEDPPDSGDEDADS